MDNFISRHFSVFEIVRIVFPSFLTIALFVFAIYVYFLPTLEQSIFLRKQKNVQEIIQVAWNILDYYYKEEQSGRMIRKDAQAKAIDQIGSLRYGEDNKDYFWINDLEPRMIVHPYRADLDGRDLSNFTDPNGKHLFVEMVNTVLESEAGFVDYVWQWKDDSSVLLPKESYVRLFSPWGWIVGTGLYFSDIEQEIGTIKRKFLLTASAILVLILVLSFWIVKQRIESEKRRARAEKQLRQEQRRLQDIVEFLPDATFVIDREKRVIAWNRAIETMTGVKKEDVLGKGDYEYAKCFYGNPRPLLIDYVMEQREDISVLYKNFKENKGTYSGETFVPTLQRGRNGYALVTASPLVNEFGEKVGAIESIRDITEQKSIEESLRASEENYRSIFNGANDLILIHDPQTGSILDANQKACAVFGYNVDELSRLDMSFLSSGEENYTLEDALDRIHRAARGEAQFFEWHLKNRDGRFFWGEVDLKKVSVHGKDRVMAMVRDIDRRKTYEEEKQHLEEQLRQSQKMEAVGKLAGGVAHDFNNLLTVIHGYSDIAFKQAESTPSIQKNLTEVKKAAERAESITRQLLAFSRRQLIQPRILDLNEIIKNLDKMLRRLIGEDVEMRMVLSSDLGVVRADPNQIEQVIINLAVNARDAMPRGGKLTIETHNAALDDRYAQQHVGVWPGKYVMLAMSDTGCGMEKSVQSRIFEPFFTTKGKGEGTGLGLSMVYGIVKQNGGNIYVYSEVGRGSVFKVYLPLVRDDSYVMEKEETKPAVPHGTETILLVEDERSVLGLVGTILEELGYNVFSANSADEAIGIFEKNGNAVQLLLTDVIMPYKSGKELADLLVKEKPALKVLYMSGYTDDAIVSHGVLEPGIAFIQKPFVPSALAQKVRSVLDS